MKLECKCKCPTSSHGHKPGKCDGLATEPDELCDTCREKTAEELPKIPEYKPLAHLSKHERRLRAPR
jgi:hypothetical protein